MAKFATLVDTFTSLDAAKWTFAANATLNAGRLQLSTTSTYQGAITVAAYDLVDSFVGLEVAKTAGDIVAGGTVDTSFQLDLDGSNNLSITREATQLYFQRLVGGVGTEVARVTYNATTNRWWRIRHDTADGLVKWQTSGDGTTWTTHGTWAPTFAITALKANLNTGSYSGSVTGDLTALFDNVNSTGVVPDTTAPTVPAGVTATANNATQVTVTWTASTDDVAVASYRVRRGGVDVTGATAVTGTSAVVTGLTASTAYSFTVSAVDAAGNRSAESTAATVTTPAAVATSASTTWQSEVSPTALQLGWIINQGTSVRAVASLASTFTSPIYGNTITRPASGWCTSRVTGLTANTLYYTGVEVDGAIIATGRGQYRTLRTDLAASKVITSSCIGTPGNGPVYARIAAEGAAFFTQQGDIHYWDATTDADWRQGFNDVMTSAGMTSVLASTPMTYFWNNHDWGGDESYKDSPVAAYAPPAVRELSGATVYPDAKGLWRTWVHAGVRYINLDPYAHRSFYNDGDSAAKTMLGATQKAWLLNLFQTASEPAIIVFSGFAHPSTPAVLGRWANYPNERVEIGNAIAALPATQRNKIVFVGGDTHNIAADDGTNAMWGRPSLNVSPMEGSGGFTATGTWNIANIVADAPAHGYYSRLTFTPATTTLAMTWDAVRDDGVVLATWSTSFPLPAGKLIDRWNGTTLVRQRADRWNGTALVQQTASN